MQADQEQKFLDAAEAAGIGADQARELARRYGLVPKNVTTEIQVTGAERAEEILANIARDRVATVTTQVRNAYAQYGSGYVPEHAQQRASGGYVDGPGGGLDDRIPTNLSRGGYVLDAQTVQRIGTGRLDQINNGQTGPSTSPKPGPIALDQATIRALADAIGTAVLAGATKVSAGVVNEHQRTQQLAGRPT